MMAVSPILWIASSCSWHIVVRMSVMSYFFFFFQAEDGLRDLTVTGVQTCALPICTASAQATGGAEDNLKQKNIALPPPVTPVANYVPAVRVGNLLFLSGLGPGQSTPRGKVGKDLSLEQGYQAARATGLNLLATARATLGSLDRVTSIVMVLGMAHSAP